VVPVDRDHSRSRTWFNTFTPDAVVARKAHKETTTMIKLTLRYARYALSTLATVGFGERIN